MQLADGTGIMYGVAPTVDLPVRSVQLARMLARHEDNILVGAGHWSSGLAPPRRLGVVPEQSEAKGNESCASLGEEGTVTLVPAVQL